MQCSLSYGARTELPHPFFDVCQESSQVSTKQFYAYIVHKSTHSGDALVHKRQIKPQSCEATMSDNNQIYSSFAVQEPVPINQMKSFRSAMQGKTQAQFIFYINAIMDYLRASAPPFVAVQVKLIISECVKKNQAGDPSYCPLRRSIILSIQRCIGPAHWALANLHFKRSHQQHALYANLKRLQTMSTVQAPLPNPIKNISLPIPPTHQSLAEQLAILDILSNMVA